MYLSLSLFPLPHSLFFSIRCQVRAQTRTDSSRSFDSHSSSTISSDAVGGGGRPAPPPVALKPTMGRLNHPSDEQSPPERQEEGDPSNKSFLGKVTVNMKVVSVSL